MYKGISKASPETCQTTKMNFSWQHKTYNCLDKNYIFQTTRYNYAFQTTKMKRFAKIVNR